MFDDYGYYRGYGYGSSGFGILGLGLRDIIFMLLVIWLLGKIALKTVNYDLEKGCELERNTVGVLDPMNDLSFQQCKLRAEKSIRTWTFVNKIVPYILLGCIVLFIVQKFNVI